MSIESADDNIEVYQSLIDEVSDEVADEVKEQLMEDLPPAIAEELQELEPLSPRNGIDRFLDQKEERVDDISPYEIKMDYFCEFLEDEINLENLNNLTSRQLKRYKSWRKYESLDREKPLGVKTLKDDMHQVEACMEYLVGIEAVQAKVLMVIEIPDLDPEDGVCKETLAPSRTARILRYLEKFQHASMEHVTILLFAKTGRRPCDLHSLDLVDFTYDGDEATLEFVHRPDGTALKEGQLHEAEIKLNTGVAEVIQDYIDYNRENVTDAHGREPLLTSSEGRLSKSTMQKYAYKWTRPGAIGADPDDHDVSNCDGMESAHDAHRCARSKSPKMIRSGYITAKLNHATYEAVGHRVGATTAVLKKHYDHPDNDEERKRYQDEITGTGDEAESGYAN